MKYKIKSIMETPLIKINNGSIVHVNQTFLSLTEYQAEDLLNKEMSYVLQTLLRSKLEPDLNCESQKLEGYIFTKSLLYREVKVLEKKLITGGMTVLEFLDRPSRTIRSGLPVMVKLLEENQVGIGIYKLPEMVLIKANQTYLDSFDEKFNKKELAIGRLLKDIVSDFEGSRAETLWLRMIENNASLYLNSMKGSVRAWQGKYYDNVLTPISEYGQVKYIVSMLTDVTERELNKERLAKQAEELVLQKKQLEAVIENMSDACSIIDRNGRYIVNKKARGLTPSIEIKKPGDWFDGARFYDAERNELAIESLPDCKVMNGETLNNYRIIMESDGKEIHFDVNGTPVYDEYGKFLIGVSCFHDMTAYIKQSQEIERKWKELYSILNSLPDALYVLSSDGRYIFMNEAAKMFMPEVKANYAGDSSSVILYYDMEGNRIPQDNLPAKKVLRGEQVYGERIKLVYGGEEKFINTSGTPILNAQGIIEYAVISSRDITEMVEKENQIKKQHEQLLEAEKEKNMALQKTIEKIAVISRLEELNTMKDKLFTIVTHDVRHPFTTLLTLMEILDEEKVYCNSDSRELIDEVAEHIKRTYMMVENLLEWFRSQMKGLRHNPEPLALYDAVQEAVQDSRINGAVKGLRMTVEISRDIMVLADREMLEIVLRNLLSNAVKFTHKGGLISISACRTDNKIVTAVSDTGVGICTAKAKELFDNTDFYTTLGTEGEKGRGMGLKICKELVCQNGGEIWAESIPGKGSSFYFSLPVQA